MKENKLIAVFYDIYDEETNKTLHVKANSLEEAIGIADTLDWDWQVDGDRVDVLDDIANYEVVEFIKELNKKS